MCYKSFCFTLKFVFHLLHQIVFENYAEDLLSIVTKISKIHWEKKCGREFGVKVKVTREHSMEFIVTFE